MEDGNFFIRTNAEPIFSGILRLWPLIFCVFLPMSLRPALSFFLLRTCQARVELLFILQLDDVPLSLYILTGNVILYKTWNTYR